MWLTGIKEDAGVSGDGVVEVRCGIMGNRRRRRVLLFPDPSRPNPNHGSPSSISISTTESRKCRKSLEKESYLEEKQGR